METLLWKIAGVIHVTKTMAVSGVQLLQTFYNNDAYAAQFPCSHKTTIQNLDDSNETFY